MQSMPMPGATPPDPTLSFAAPAAGAHALDAAEVEHFRRRGWVGRYPLLTTADVAQVHRVRDQVVDGFTLPEQLARATQPDAFERRPWFKSMHAHVPLFHDIARHPAIVGRVASLLGPDVMVWGLVTIRSWPGKLHRWHVDVENLRWPGVNAYIGLTDIDERSTLKVVEGTHRIGRPPQAFGVDKDDGVALAAARQQVPDSRVTTVPLSPGEFSLFDGLLWHGSHNTGERERLAMIVHYARPDADVRVPLNFDEPIRWHPTRPPCVMVSGQDRHGINRQVGRPGAAA